MTRVAIIGSGPTGIYTLKGLIASDKPLHITVYEETPDAGKGTPYHPAVNDRAMLANIASIEIPEIEESLATWLRGRSDVELAELEIDRSAIGEREFYPRVVLGEFLAAQFWKLVVRGRSMGHVIDVKPSHRILDITLAKSAITLSHCTRAGRDGSAVFDHVVMATGHDWPEDTETSPGYFVSPWPASAIKRIQPRKVGILGTSLSAIDAVVSVATTHGMFLRGDADVLRYRPSNDTDGLRMTMMSRKGLLPEADFFCPIPYEPLSICTPEAVRKLITEAPDRLLDEVFELFKQELAAADADYAASIGLALATVENLSERYFRARADADRFVWAASNLAEAKSNKLRKKTVEWRYAILRMHEVIALAVPHLNERDLNRFHKDFKSVFVDDYATVPHQSVERLIALHQAGKLEVLALGDDYEVVCREGTPGVIVTTLEGDRWFDAFIDATGQHALSASDLPFPSLRRPELLKEALTRTTPSAGLAKSMKRTGGIDVDDQFRVRVKADVCRELYCVSIPFLLHKLPFVQGIASAHEIGTLVARSVVAEADRDGIITPHEDGQVTKTVSPLTTIPSKITSR